ncbi:MAG: TolC family protein [Cyclobacteriaceae bacterium]
MRIFLVASLFIIANLTFAQNESVATKLTLDDCIETALDRNISLKQARNNQIIAESNHFQAIMNFFPTLSAGINYDFYSGTFFDNNAARQVSEISNSSNPNVSSNLILFNGFSNYFQLQQRKHEQVASLATMENTKQNVETTIISLYLNVILDKENVKIASERVELLDAQLNRERKRESVGVGNLESVYNFQSQLATQKLILNNLENTLQRDLLSLFQAMQLDPSEGEIEVQPYDIPESDLLLELEPFDVVLNQIINESPALKASESAYKASKYQLKSSRAQRSPTLSVFGRLGSNYSSNGATNPSKPFINPDNPDEQGFNFEPDATFFEQIDYNQFKYVNLSLNIPIFTRFQTSNRIQIAKVGMANAELDVAAANNNITNLVQTAYLDLVTAQNTYVSTKENLEASTQAFDFMKKRYETGNTDFFTYLESLNNKNRTEIELVNAKYSIVFRKKILDLYRGL